jgi:aquaporin Z
VTAELHLAENTLALHLLLQRLEGLIDVVIANENLHAASSFNGSDWNSGKVKGRQKAWPLTLSARMYQTKPPMSTGGSWIYAENGPNRLRELARKLVSSLQCLFACLAWIFAQKRRERAMNRKKYAAEAIGTFWLTFAGCGSAVIAAAFPQVGIGLLGVALTFGLSVVTMAYAIGHVSGCHLNPAVTVGLAAGGRFPAGQIAPYVIAQLIGAVAAAALLYVIASGAPGFDVSKGFASNGYGPHSPGQYSLVACFITEVVMTMMFLFIIMGATHGRAPAGFAPLAIGLALVMIHLVSIPVTNTSVNPARSTGPALFVGGWALAQLWLFWLAPLIGGVLGGVIYRWLSEEPEGVVEGRAPA